MTSVMQFGGDALGSLICYGLDTNGVRRVTRDMFEDGMDGAQYNSTVVLSVFHLPTSSTDYYGYTIDVTLPPLPANTTCGANGLDCNFALLEGFDSSVFGTSAGNSTSGIGGQWCLAPAGVQACQFPPPQGGTSGVGGNINVNYANFGVGGLPTLTAPIAPAAAKTYHFVAFRYLKTGVNSLPASGAPVVIAALFSASDLEENKLDDNVAAGANQVANLAPSVVTTGDTWTTFSNKLGSLVENTDSSTLTFTVTDADTAGTITAAVTLALPGGISVAVPQTNCSSTTIPSGQSAASNCTLDIPLNNAAWWNASVDSTYDGLFNTVATDASNGSYASGVSASAKIVVTDSLGKASTALSVPIHVFSSVNNVPVIASASPFAQATDPHNSLSYATYSCSVGGNTCGASDLRGHLLVDAVQSIKASPGPAAAFDELAAQTTAVVPYSDPNDQFTNVHCVNEQQAATFVSGGAPIVAPTGGPDPTQYDMNFLVTSTPPASAVSAICTLTITDQSAAFPNGQTAKTATKDFRVVINP